MVNAVPMANTTLAGFGAICSPPGFQYRTFKGANREKWVSHFTLRMIIILMETIKDAYISVGQVPLDGTLGRGSRCWQMMRRSARHPAA
jgi:hypothetical protein